MFCLCGVLTHLFTLHWQNNAECSGPYLVFTSSRTKKLCFFLVLSGSLVLGQDLKPQTLQMEPDQTNQFIAPV